MSCVMISFVRLIIWRDMGECFRYAPRDNDNGHSLSRTLPFRGLLKPSLFQTSPVRLGISFVNCDRADKVLLV